MPYSAKDIGSFRLPPGPFEGDSVILRLVRIQDAEPFFEMDRDPEVMRFLPVDVPDTLDGYRASLAGELESGGYRAHSYTVLEKESMDVAGWVLLRPEEGADHLELGFRLLRRFWGRGLATAASRVALDIAFEKLGAQAVAGHAAAENRASVRVMEKLGMAYWKDGTWRGLPQKSYILWEKNWRRRT